MIKRSRSRVDLGNVRSDPRFPSVAARVRAVRWLMANMTTEEEQLLQRLGLKPSGFDDLGKVTAALCGHTVTMTDISGVLKLVAAFGRVRNGGKGRGMTGLEKEARNYPEFASLRKSLVIPYAGFFVVNVVACAILRKIRRYHYDSKRKTRYSHVTCVQLTLYTVQQFGCYDTK